MVKAFFWFIKEGQLFQIKILDIILIRGTKHNNLCFGFKFSDIQSFKSVKQTVRHFNHSVSMVDIIELHLQNNEMKHHVYLKHGGSIYRENNKGSG